MPRQMTIDYPESLPDMLQESREQFEHEAQMAMAVKLFDMKRISSEVAASLVGIDRISFLLQLHLYGISAVNLDEDDLTSDIANA